MSELDQLGRLQKENKELKEKFQYMREFLVSMKTTFDIMLPDDKIKYKLIEAFDNLLLELKFE